MTPVRCPEQVEGLRCLFDQGHDDTHHTPHTAFRDGGHGDRLDWWTGQPPTVRRVVHDIVCHICGETFPAPKIGGAKYCSRKCNRVAGAIRNAKSKARTAKKADAA